MLDEITRLGGGLVESYPEDTVGRQVSGSFLHNCTVTMFERHGFERGRQIGKLTATTLLGGLLVAGLSQHELWPLTSLPARWPGRRSYALSLWHPFVGAIFFHQFRLGDGWAMLVCVLLTSVFIAHTTHRFVGPFREVGRRLADPAAVAVPGDQLHTRMRGAVAS